MKQPEDKNTFEIALEEAIRDGKRRKPYKLTPKHKSDPSYGPTPEQKEAMQKEQQRAQNAARQAKYRERAKERGQTPTAIVLDKDIDLSLQTLCVHNGCDRRAIIQALIETAWSEMFNGLSTEEWDNLMKETFRARTRKHRVYKDGVTE